MKDGYCTVVCIYDDIFEEVTSCEDCPLSRGLGGEEQFVTKKKRR